jgi:hypothetical protein
MIFSKKLLIASSLLLIAGSFSAQAEGLELGADAGFGVMNFDSNSSTNAARTYYGLSGNVEACDTGGVDFNLCGGVSGFTTLGKRSKTAAGVTVKTGINSVGAFVKAKKKMGEGTTIAPYAGIARVNANHEISGGGGTVNERSNIVFGGLEFAKQLSGNMSLSLKAEAGRSVGSSTRTNVYSFKPGLKVKF